LNQQVGKSSLLNALLRRKVVRSSFVPGKTKHFQTYHLNPLLRLIDSPGIVFPSVSSFPLQILGGIVPIQNIPIAMNYVCERIPLESIEEVLLEDEDGNLLHGDQRKREWTVEALLEAHARAKGMYRKL
jgi:ribosome biogenesis GTPase A